MADSHSPVGSCPSQHIPVYQSLSRKEKMLFARKSWDQGRTEVSNDKKFSLGTGVNQHRNRGSTNSDKSSNATRNSSVTSKTGYRTSVEVVPRLCTTPLSKRESMPSKSSLKTSHVQPKTLSEMSISRAEAQRPASPRRQISTFQAEHSSRPKAVYSGPLERFIAQDNGPMEFGGDREEEWRQLRALRANTLRLRFQVREMRTKLHTKELAMSTADEAFIKYVREQRSASILQPETRTSRIEDPSLDSHYAAMQDARDEYGPLNDDYNKLEDLLDQHEFEMAKIEGRLYNSQIHETSTSEPTLLGVGLSSQPPKELHPLQISYLSTLGDLDLAKERHQNMTQERDRLLYMQESRSRVDMDVPENDRDFLDQFPTKEAEILEEISKIEEAVEQQRKDCLQAGIDLAESSLEDLDDSVDDVESSESPSEEDSVDPSMFSLLLPRSVKDKVKLGVLITDFDEANKSDRINRWMRYQLQTSPLEVELLIRVFLHLLRIVDIRQWQMGPFHWQFCVLLSWEHDEANRPPEIFKPSYTRSSITESIVPAVGSVFKISHEIATFSNETSKPIRRVRSAPESIDLRKIFGKEELSTAKAPLVSF